jgi:hypothetical protein
VYPAKSGLVIGFHGCDAALVKKLISGKTTLRNSRNSYDWLGSGIYFWENNQQRALEFANELKDTQRSKIKSPAVVGAVLDLGFCLDLMDAEHIQLVEESYLNLVASCQTLGLPIPVNQNVGASTDLLLRDLDCAVVNNLHNQRRNNNLPPYDSVRSAFIEGPALYEKAGFHRKNHIQICIQNPNCIKGYFLPRKIDSKWNLP